MCDRNDAFDVPDVNEDEIRQDGTFARDGHQLLGTAQGHNSDT